ncbi:MAG: TetR/AcrR family transcriptional regulator C-terminal domain-containing protein [Leptospira sp.]|nr:TetR/AcrR family transcriptional regulator C-terminal domain-containing protein [Leptospira sp.]
MKKKRIPLNRDRILQAALKIADEKGLEQLSMRSLGAALGVEAMSLYKHVKNKEDILDGLADILLMKIEIPSLERIKTNKLQKTEPKSKRSPKTRLRELLKILFSHKREVFKKHPWAPQVIETRIAFSHVRFEFMEKQFRLMIESGYSLIESYQILLALESYVYGFCIQELNWNFDQLPKEEKFVLENFIGSDFPIVSTQYPNFFAFLELFFKRHKAGKLKSMLDEEFAKGLDRILGKV